jgi:hypothetical protein
MNARTKKTNRLATLNAFRACIATPVQLPEVLSPSSLACARPVPRLAWILLLGACAGPREDDRARSGSGGTA